MAKAKKKKAAKRKVSKKHLGVGAIDGPQINAEVAVERQALALRPYKRWEDAPPLKDDNDFQRAMVALNWTKNFLDQNNKERLKIVGPLNKVVKYVNAKFKEISEPAAEVRDKLIALGRAHDARERALQVRAAEKQAKIADRKGNAELAGDIRDLALVTSPLPKSASSNRDAWSAKVTDKKALMKAILEGSVDASFMVPNETKLNALARALKSESLGVPGVLGVRETVFARKAP